MVEINFSSTFKRFAKSTFWTTLGNASHRFFFLFSSIILARLLGKTLFGVFAMGRSTLDIFFLFSEFGLGVTATRHIGKYRDVNPLKAERIASFTILIGLLNSFLWFGILFLFSPFISKTFLNNIYLSPYLRFISLGLIFGTTPKILIGILFGLELFRVLAFLGVALSFILFAFLSLGAAFFGLKGAFEGLIFYYLASLVFSWLVFHKEIKKLKFRISTKDLLKELPLLWNFSFPALASTGILVFSTWIINAILSRQASGYAELGILASAISLRGPLIFFPTVLGYSFLPILANFYGKKDFIRYKKALLVQILVTGLTTIAAASIVIIFSSKLMGLFGSSFKESSTTLTWLAISAIPMSVSLTFDRFFQSIGKIWVGFITNLSWALTLIFFSNFFILQGEGARGIAKAFCIAYGCHFVWQGVIAFFFIKGLGKHL